jgi:hypothetical protein
VLLEKPLVLVVPEGRTIPPKLGRIADRIITVDLETETGRQRVEDEMRRFFTDFAKH